MRFSAWGYRGAGVVFKPFEPSLATDFAFLTTFATAGPVVAEVIPSLTC